MIIVEDKVRKAGNFAFKVNSLLTQFKGDRVHPGKLAGLSLTPMPCAHGGPWETDGGRQEVVLDYGEGGKATVTLPGDSDQGIKVVKIVFAFYSVKAGAEAIVEFKDELLKRMVECNASTAPAVYSK